MFSVRLVKTPSGGLEASAPQQHFPMADPQVLPFYGSRPTASDWFSSDRQAALA